MCVGGGGGPDGATDVLAAAALLCRQTRSSEPGSLCSAPITFPPLGPVILPAPCSTSGSLRSARWRSLPLGLARLRRFVFLSVPSHSGHVVMKVSEVAQSEGTTIF